MRFCYIIGLCVVYCGSMSHVISILEGYSSGSGVDCSYDRREPDHRGTLEQTTRTTWKPRWVSKVIFFFVDREPGLKLAMCII
jgi:hypothetical protein